MDGIVMIELSARPVLLKGKDIVIRARHAAGSLRTSRRKQLVHRLHLSALTSG